MVIENLKFVVYVLCACFVVVTIWFNHKIKTLEVVCGYIGRLLIESEQDKYDV